MSINTIIWDYNGTLLNDIDLCIDVMNGMLRKNGMPLISQQEYQTKFTFPVKDYYSAIGWDFDKISFEDVGHEFIDGYRERLPEAGLFSDVKTTLERIEKKGLSQHILSAMEAGFLLESVKQLGIQEHFISINGINNHLAKGKADIAQQLIDNGVLDPKRSLMIGDTLHDAEIAKAFDMKCILVASGHHSYERLSESGFPVIKTLSDLNGSI